MNISIKDLDKDGKLRPDYLERRKRAQARAQRGGKRYSHKWRGSGMRVGVKR